MFASRRRESYSSRVPTNKVLVRNYEEWGDLQLPIRVFFLSAKQLGATPTNSICFLTRRWAMVGGGQFHTFPYRAKSNQHKLLTQPYLLPPDGIQGGSHSSNDSQMRRCKERMTEAPLHALQNTAEGCRPTSPAPANIDKHALNASRWHDRQSILASQVKPKFDSAYGHASKINIIFR